MYPEFECERYNGLRYRLRHLIRLLLDTQRREYAIMILEDPVDLVIYRSTTLVTERTFYRWRNSDIIFMRGVGSIIKIGDANAIFFNILKIKRFLRFLGTCLWAINSWMVYAILNTKRNWWNFHCGIEMKFGRGDKM